MTIPRHDGSDGRPADALETRTIRDGVRAAPHIYPSDAAKLNHYRHLCNTARVIHSKTSRISAGVAAAGNVRRSLALAGA